MKRIKCGIVTDGVRVGEMTQKGIRELIPLKNTFLQCGEGWVRTTNLLHMDDPKPCDAEYLYDWDGMGRFEINSQPKKLRLKVGDVVCYRGSYRGNEPDPDHDARMQAIDEAVTEIRRREQDPITYPQAFDTISYFYDKSQYPRKLSRTTVIATHPLQLEAGPVKIVCKATGALVPAVTLGASGAKLNTLDLFCGAGGLSLGLERSGFKVKWAVEMDRNASETYKSCHDAQVFCDDVRSVLARIKSGELDIKPDAIVGGPPCQGFTVLTRASDEIREKKNSLVDVFFDYVEHLKPKFVLMENVRALLTHYDVVPAIYVRLFGLGYQVTSTVLSCTSYGVPQARRRFILIAARLDQKLPHFPEPTHQSCKFMGTTLAVKNGFKLNYDYMDEAPNSMVTVRDAISDLEEQQGDGPYVSPPLSEYQHKLRLNSCMVSCFHLTRMKGILSTRLKHTPRFYGADWRHLPNICDGPITEVIGETYPENTMIMSHLAKSRKTSPKEGTGGRLHYDFAASMIHGMIKYSTDDSRFVHPTKDRLLTVRECARIQSFPDYVDFKGPLLAQMKQVGNAVPPLLAEELGKMFTQ